jgi:3-hydroxyisobutyrate dehydrogenase-like beta-hydroxyacid dehydrogenase
MQTANELGLELPGAALVTQHLDSLMDAGDAELDSAAVLKVVEQLSGMGR